MSYVVYTRYDRTKGEWGDECRQPRRGLEERKGFQRRVACVRRGGELTTVAWLGSGGTPLNCITCVNHTRVYRLSVAAAGMKTNAFEKRRQVMRDDTAAAQRGRFKATGGV